MLFNDSFCTVGKSYEGDIALDDISLNAGYCSRSDVCDFEHGLCDGWQADLDAGFAWSRGRNGSTPSGTPTVGKRKNIDLLNISSSSDIYL